MDSFEINKILAAVLGTSLMLLVVHLFADWMFTPRIASKPGYEIAVSEKPAAGAATAKAEPQASVATRLANADPGRGKSAVRVCSTCHTFDKGGRNGIGPNLWGVVNRPRASEAGYSYSAAMKAKGGAWTYEDLDQFLAHPQAIIPGTKMTFGGIRNARQRADVIAYLRTLSDHPAPLPQASASPAPPSPGS